MFRSLAHITLLCVVAGAALAQESPQAVPFQLQRPDPNYIVPPGSNPQGTYSTKEAAPLPWQKQQPAQQLAPSGYQPSPFGHAAPNISQPLPSGPRMLEAVPVPGVDAVEVTEPAAAEQSPLEANPVADDPSKATEQTAPIFEANADDRAPRKVVLRVLNKVTARAEELIARPGEKVRFGKLEIMAVNCHNSKAGSQPDSAALIDIFEQVPDQEKPTLLFRGWMYASSPSVTSLEHPIYDVTLAECKVRLVPKVAEKTAKKPTKAAAKKSR